MAPQLRVMTSLPEGPRSIPGLTSVSPVPENSRPFLGDLLGHHTGMCTQAYIQAKHHTHKYKEKDEEESGEPATGT